MKRKKKYQPRLIKIPVTSTLRDEIAMQIRLGLESLKTNPDIDSFCAVAAIMNMVGFAAKDDTRFKDEIVIIESGMRMMNQVVNKCESGFRLKDYEVCCINNAVNKIDSILPYMDVTKLHLAQLSINRMKRLNEINTCMQMNHET